MLDLRSALGVNAKTFSNPAGQEQYIQAIESVHFRRLLLIKLISRHLSSHAAHFFPPTLAILGGFLAQDVLRSLSRKDTPIYNLLVIDSMGGTGTTTRWGMSPPKVVQ